MSRPAIPGHLTHAEPDLSPRQRQVFAALVTLHGRTARPIGSEILARESAVAFSPASVRASLSELEELGLLERPHSAAGRVPSAQGYEYFVRVIVEPEPLPAELQDELDRRLHGSARDVEHLLAEASRLISSLTHQLGLAHAATLDREILLALDLERLDDRRALMLLHLGAATVRTVVLELESPLSGEEIAGVCAELRDRLIGLPLAEVRERLATDPALAQGGAARCVVRAATERWAEPAPAALISAGMSHIADQPEFMNAARLGQILRVIEHGAPLDRMMAETVEGQATVRVGLDESPTLAACSLVSYALPGSPWGALGVLGPRRMDYARVLAVVDAVGNRVTDLLHG